MIMLKDTSVGANLWSYKLRFLEEGLDGFWLPPHLDRLDCGLRPKPFLILLNGTPLDFSTPESDCARVILCPFIFSLYMLTLYRELFLLRSGVRS